jgi:uncharacterized membrane protein
MDRSDPGCWKAQVFHYNPDDPALWIPRKGAGGHKLNMARPGSWAIVCLLIVIMTTVRVPAPGRGAFHH